MEWIKAKYDRVLLGFCGLVALIVGAILLMKALGFKKQFSNTDDGPGNKQNFGGDTGALVESALQRLTAPAVVQAPMSGKVPIKLFNSAPVVKKAGDEKTISVYGDEKIRPPVDNAWLFENNLDLLRTNILDLDSDGDNFTNLEEFEANPKTNPRDATSHPEVVAKIKYRELVQIPLSIRLNAYTSPTEITFRVTTASPETTYSTKVIGPGGKIQSAKGGEDRFVIKKIDGSAPGKEFAILDDLKTGQKDIKAVKGEEVSFPINQAKLECTLGKVEEKIVSKDEEFSFEVDPDQKYTVKDITPEAVTLEYTPKGGSEKKTAVIKIPPPP